MAVLVPAPARREDDVARLHRRLLAIDRRVRPVRVDDHAQGMRRVPVRWCFLAGKNHLIGGHQRPGRHHAIAAERIAHDEVAPIRKRHVDQPPGCIERRLAHVVAPVRRHVFRLLLSGR
jgi:hypothetical protein